MFALSESGLQSLRDAIIRFCMSDVNLYCTNQ